MSANWIEEFHNGRSAGIVLIEFLKLSAMLFIQTYPFTSMNSHFYLPTLDTRSDTFSTVSADTSIKISIRRFPSA